MARTKQKPRNRGNNYKRKHEETEEPILVYTNTSTILGVQKAPPPNPRKKRRIETNQQEQQHQTQILQQDTGRNTTNCNSSNNSNNNSNYNNNSNINNSNDNSNNHNNNNINNMLTNKNTQLSEGLLPQELWKLVFYFSDTKSLRSLFYICKLFAKIIFSEDKLWFRVSPGILELNWKKMGQGPEDAREFFSPNIYGQKQVTCAEFCDDPVHKYLVQPDYEMIEEMSKENWVWIDGRIFTDESLKDYLPDYKRNVLIKDDCYESTWESRDTGSVIRLTYLCGDGVLGIDNKIKALVVGCSGAHPTVSSNEYQYINSHGSGPQLDLHLARYVKKKLDKDNPKKASKRKKSSTAITTAMTTAMTTTITTAMSTVESNDEQQPAEEEQEYILSFDIEDYHKTENIEEFIPKIEISDLFKEFRKFLELVRYRDEDQEEEEEEEEEEQEEADEKQNDDYKANRGNKKNN